MDDDAIGLDRLQNQKPSAISTHFGSTLPRARSAVGIPVQTPPNYRIGVRKFVLLALYDGAGLL